MDLNRVFEAVLRETDKSIYIKKLVDEFANDDDVMEGFPGM